MKDNITVNELLQKAKEKNTQHQNTTPILNVRDKTQQSANVTISDMLSIVRKNNAIDPFYEYDAYESAKREANGYVDMLSNMSNSGESVLDDASHAQLEKYFDLNAVYEPEGRAMSGEEVLRKYGVTSASSGEIAKNSDTDGLAAIIMDQLVDQKKSPSEEICDDLSPYLTEIDNARLFVDEAQKIFNIPDGVYQSDYKDRYEYSVKKADDYIGKHDLIIDIIEDKRQLLGDEWADNAIKKAIQTFDFYMQVKSIAQDYYDYWDQYESEEQYYDYTYAKKYAQSTYGELSSQKNHLYRKLRTEGADTESIKREIAWIEALESVTGEDMLAELVRLQGIRDNSTNDIVNDALDERIHQVQQLLVGMTDSEQAKVYQTMTDEYKNLDEYLAYEKQEVASLSERRDSLKKELAKYTPGSTVYSYEQAKREYDMVCAELDEHISLYKGLQARQKDIESNRATYEALEKLETEWREKTASWGERTAYTLKDILDAFGRGALETTTSAADFLGMILNPIGHSLSKNLYNFVGNTLLDEDGDVDVDFKRGWDSVSEDVYDVVKDVVTSGAFTKVDIAKKVLFDKDGKLNISFKRAWDATMNDMHVHLTEGGIRHSPLVSKLLDKPEEDSLTTYDPSYNNDFTNFTENVASGIGAFVPGVALAAVTGGSSVLIQGVIFGASTYHSSYNEAINNGATMGEAHAYASITGSVAAASEAIIGTPLEKGAGIVGKIISDSKIVNPTLRTVYSWAASSFGEGVEEMIESLIGTAAKVWTYDNDARVDVSELLYEGLVGASVGALINSTRISGEYKAYKQDADHIHELIAQAEKISSPAEAQAFINDLIATSTLIDAELKNGKTKYKENAEWLMYHYNAIAEAVTQKLPELVAQNGDVKVMRNNIDSIVLKGEGKSGTAYDSYGAEIASVLAGTDVQLYEAMLERTDLAPEVRAELETQLEALKTIVERYSLVDYSKKRITNSDSKQQKRAAVKKTATKKTEVDRESVIRGAYDKVSSSPEALDKVIAEMRADGINVETLVKTERERLLGSLSRAYSESKYSGVQGDNRGIISYLEAVETAAKDQNYIKRLIAAEYLAKKQLKLSSNTAERSSAPDSTEISGVSDITLSEQTSNAVDKTSVDNSAENGIIETKTSDARSDINDVVEIYLSKSSYPESAQHILDAISAGQPDVLTIDREGATANRRKALDGYEKSSEFDLDEYPPAMFKEGGKGASVRAISRSDNRGAGSKIGHQLRKYPNGTKVKIIITD